jgi:hypothetical protein
MREPGEVSPDDAGGMLLSPAMCACPVIDTDGRLQPVGVSTVCGQNLTAIAHSVVSVTYTDDGTLELKLAGLGNGSYTATIIAENANGKSSPVGLAFMITNK